MTYQTELMSATALQDVAPFNELSESREMRPNTFAEVGEGAEQAFKNVSELQAKAPKVYEALLMAFAFRACRQMQASNNRISQALRDHRRQ